MHTRIRIPLETAPDADPRNGGAGRVDKIAAAALPSTGSGWRQGLEGGRLKPTVKGTSSSEPLRATPHEIGTSECLRDCLGKLVSYNLGGVSSLPRWASSVRGLTAGPLRLAAQQPARLVLCDDRYCSVLAVWFRRCCVHVGPPASGCGLHLSGSDPCVECIYTTVGRGRSATFI